MADRSVSVPMNLSDHNPSFKVTIDIYTKSNISKTLRDKVSIEH